jgi:hypothetical protein
MIAGTLVSISLYSELKHEFRNARAFPNSGVPDARDQGRIRQQVRAALGL